MTQEELQLFIKLLFSHRHLWTMFEEYRYLHEHPDVDWKTAHEAFFEESEEAYQSLADALLEGKPIAERLQTVLSQSELTMAEALQKLRME
jgi:hypothetical protein